MAIDRSVLLKEIDRWNIKSLPAVSELLNAVVSRTGERQYRVLTFDNTAYSFLSNLSERRGGLVPERYTKVAKGTSKDPKQDVWEYTLVPKGTATVTITYADNTKKEVVSVERTK